MSSHAPTHPSSFASTRQPRPHSRAAERASQVRFRRAVSLMAMTLLAPGTAQLTAGNRRLGLAVFRTWLGLLAVLVVILTAVVAHRPFLFWLATNTTLLLVINLGLIVLAVGWAALLVDAWRIGQPLSYAMSQRRITIALNGVLCFAVAGTLLFGSHLAGVTRDALLALSGDGEVSDASHGRFNVLLMGGDAGAGRWGLRPDSLTVASVDAETGRTVLIALPRNMASFPFAEGSVMDRQFPRGFDCDDCMLNGVSTWAGDHTDLFRHSENPGIDATVSAVEGITDLDISYWAMVNLEGFKNLVDAVGGVTLTVRQPIPVGGLGDDVTGYLEPGTRKLDGFETLWYARAREGSDDYSRMARQKCVMNAMLEQISPQSALRHFESIARASSDMVSTNVPVSEFDRFLDLALRAKGQKISTLSLVPPMVNTADPDIALIHRKVAEAIGKAEGDAPKPEAGSKPQRRGAASGPAGTTTESVTGGSYGSLSEGYAANQSDDLDTTC